jgi:hypothetical protein
VLIADVLSAIGLSLKTKAVHLQENPNGIRSVNG